MATKKRSGRGKHTWAGQPLVLLRKVHAKRTLTTQDGRRVTVAIGQPVYLASRCHWVCPFRILGLGRPIQGQAPGIDGVQALQLVQLRIRNCLEETGASLQWLGRDYWQAGFPKHILGLGVPELEALLEDKLNDEVALWIEGQHARLRG